jgi:DNA-binding MarR family transcriptional regulator
MPRSNRTAEGAAATDVVLETFRANGMFLAAGDLLAAFKGLTSARWQVLGSLKLARRPLTVPGIAQRMGLTRQSVQATVNQLVREALVETDNNPVHRRSPLIRLTEAGHDTYGELDVRQIGWINALAAGLSVAELATTARVLRELTTRLESNVHRNEGRSDGHEANP